MKASMGGNMSKYTVAAVLFAVLEAGDDPKDWRNIFSDVQEEDLPHFVRLHAAIKLAIEMLLEKAE